MHASRTYNVASSNFHSAVSSNIHTSGKSAKEKIISLAEEGGKNWLGKMYQQFQLAGNHFFNELELKKYPDYNNIMNCLCKFRREDEHLKKECDLIRDDEFEYKQNEIDKDDISKELYEEIENAFSVMTDEKYFIMYIPGTFASIIMYRVDKKCDFFYFNPEGIEEEFDSFDCKVIVNYVVKEHINDIKKKCCLGKNKYVPVIGFYIN